jgi:hypothetical protein
MVYPFKINANQGLRKSFERIEHGLPVNRLKVTYSFAQIDWYPLVAIQKKSLHGEFHIRAYDT